jgi:hypothetical protein
VPDNFASADVFHLGGKEAAAPIFESILGDVDALFDGVRVAYKPIAVRRG